MWKMSFLRRYLLYMEKELVTIVITFQKHFYSLEVCHLGQPFVTLKTISILTAFTTGNGNVSQF